ncbi:hypothetical protein N665_0315s0006, partial [Sinapis alba]
MYDKHHQREIPIKFGTRGFLRFSIPIARAHRRHLLLWFLVFPFDSYHLSAAFVIFFKFSFLDLTSTICVATRWSQLIGAALFSTASLVNVNLDALSNPPPNWSLQLIQPAAMLFLFRVLTLEKFLSDSPVTHVPVHRCLMMSSPPSMCSPVTSMYLIYLLAPPSNTKTPPVHNQAPLCGFPQAQLSDPAG